MLRDIYYDLPNADRHYFLLQLEFDENDQKWELFLDILKTPDKNESYYDILAIEVLKILKLSDIPPSYIEQLLAIYIGILKSGSDDDIRNYTIMSSVNFININKELKDTIIEILFEFIVDTEAQIALLVSTHLTILPLAKEFVTKTTLSIPARTPLTNH